MQDFSAVKVESDDDDSSLNDSGSAENLDIDDSEQ